MQSYKFLEEFEQLKSEWFVLTTCRHCARRIVVIGVDQEKDDDLKCPYCRGSHTVKFFAKPKFYMHGNHVDKKALKARKKELANSGRRVEYLDRESCRIKRGIEEG